MAQDKGFSAERAGAFDFSSIAARLPQQQQKSSFKDGTLHAYAELGDIKGLAKLVEMGLDEGKPSSMTLNLKEDVMGREAIHIAVQKAHTDVVKWMISQHVNLGATDNFGVTPLHLAAQNNDVKTMEVILSKRTSCVDVDHCKETPLHWAATKGSTEAVKLLLKKGSPIDPFNHPECATPLMRAAFNGQYATVETLLDAGANLYNRNRDGNTVLHQACFMNHVNVIELLVSRATTAFISQPNAKNQTAHDLCITDLAREALTNPPGQAAPHPAPAPAPVTAPAPAPASARPVADTEDPFDRAAREYREAEMERLLSRRREADTEFPDVA